MALSSKEKALKALRSRMRIIPSSQDIDNMFVAFRRGDDRTTAVLGATMVESMLKLAILTKFRKPLSREAEDRLFGPDRPLSTFSAKINLGYALNLCTKQDVHNLDSIRVIRNACAHDAKPTSFTTHEIMEVCRHLHLPPHLQNKRRFLRRQFLWVVGDLSVKFGTIARSDFDGPLPSDRIRR